MNAIVCPTVTALNAHEYREQMERIAPFAERVHIDLADGVFAPVKLMGLGHVWWPVGVTADIHLMFEAVKPFLKQLIELKPHMVIVHAEAVGKFVDIAEPLHKAGIKVGVALLAHTPVSRIAPSISTIDHVLIFSGDLGHFGGTADMDLLEKVKQLKKLRNSLEIGWDGGINEHNAKKLIQHGVDVLNVGGGIQRAEHPHQAYDKLKALTS